jgi:two-component system response regulator HydG
MFAEKNHKKIRNITPQAMDRMLKYGWPGNVRELMNAIERAVVLARSEYLDEEDLPPVVQDEELKSQDVTPESVPGNLPLDEVEKATILKTLEASRGNKSETARRLGITRKTLHKKLKKYGAMP